MQLLEIGSDPKRIRAFLDMPNALYKEHPNWIRPLDKDIEEVFNPETNRFFRHGSAVRYILQNPEGQTIGRAAAFIDRKAAKQAPQPTGGMGFFECINNREAAFMLFNACKEWNTAGGMQAMDGPVNFGERDRFWGLHTSGNFPPNYGMFYHPPYYKTLFEEYGFRKYFGQLTYSRPVMQPLNELVQRKADRLAENPDLEYRHIDLKNVDAYARDFMDVYNKAWVKHGKAMGEAQAKLLFRKMKPVMDPRIIWFAYNAGQPVAFFIMLPELNQIFRHFNGKFGWWQKLQFLYYKYSGHTDKILGLVFGVIPEFQGRGLDAALVAAAGKVVQVSNQKYKTLEMNWIGDFNHTMMHAVSVFDAEVIKEHTTYRLLFNPQAPWVPHPVL